MRLRPSNIPPPPQLRLAVTVEKELAHPGLIPPLGADLCKSEIDVAAAETGLRGLRFLTP